MKAILWKDLKHPNILPLLGLVELSNPRRPGWFGLVAPWIAGGDILEYAKLHPDVNRVDLVKRTARQF
jgi:hypothetical protein